MTANDVIFIKKLVKIILAVIKVCTVAIIEASWNNLESYNNSTEKVDSIFEDAITQIDRI